MQQGLARAANDRSREANDRSGAVKSTKFERLAAVVRRVCRCHRRLAAGRVLLHADTDDEVSHRLAYGRSPRRLRR